MTAYYNEIDTFAVAWLRALIAEGVIADGIVDDRSIELVEPEDLKGFTQCHFFAGIGVWSYALRRAGWSDDRPVWTGSCPCQPFSSAGKNEGFADPRHLWPSWFRLARVYRPQSIFGEQVSAAIRSGWIDLVSTDMETEGYAVGSTVFGSHSVGAPHQRQRLYFVADWIAGRIPDADSERRTGVDALLRPEADGRQRAGALSETSRSRSFVGLANADDERQRPADDAEGNRNVGRSGEIIGLSDNDATERTRAVDESTAERPEDGRRLHGEHDREVADDGRVSSGIPDTTDNRRRGRGQSQPEGEVRQIESSRPGATGVMGDSERARLERHDGYVDHWDQPRRLRTFAAGSTTPTGILGGFWDGAEWVECTDGKARPVEPGSFPLAYGSPARVGRLRGYGNAINAEAAIAFIQAYREVKGEL